MNSLLQTWYIFMMVLAGVTICFLKDAMVVDVNNSDSLKILLFVLLVDCIVENLMKLIRLMRS